MNFKKHLIFILLCPSVAIADGSAIDKVYHPYVQMLEQEIELRMIDANGDQVYRLGVGQSLSDSLFVEAYIVAKEENNHFKIEAYEIEAKWQLSEQGEYNVDWGVLLELEKEQHNDTWEASATLLMEKQWGRWVGTANISTIYEWGPEIDDELESAAALQLRYRYSRYLEPAIEFYKGQNSNGLGPVLMGDIRLASAKKVHWEVGAILGLNAETPANTWRFLLEYEF